MDLWFGDMNSENTGPGDYIFNFEQPSPTPRVGQSSNSNSMLPRMSTSQSGESLSDLPHPGCPSSANLFSYPWGPKEGWAGSQICIKLDINSEALLANGLLPDRMVLVLGAYTLHTVNRLLTGGQCRIRNGQIRVLTATIPEKGQGFDYETGQTLPIFVQLLDGQNESAETLHMGEWTFNVNQVMLGAPGVPKRERENDLVEVDRGEPQPRWPEHRRSRTTGAMPIPPPLAPNMVGHPAMSHQFDGHTMYIAAPTPTSMSTFVFLV
jgi:hypothetical protein